MKSFYCESQILAHREQVWDVLMHTEEYPRWNPYIRSVNGMEDGPLSVGQHVDIEIQPVGQKPITESFVVDEIKPGREIAFVRGGGVSGFRYTIALRPVQDQWTLVLQTGSFTGMLSPLAPAEKHKLACEQMAEELRKVVEHHQEPILSPN